MVPQLHKDKQELIQRLFAVATMIASEAEELAVNGQSPKLSTRQYRATASQLANRADELAHVVKAIDIMSRR